MLFERYRNLPTDENVTVNPPNSSEQPDDRGSLATWYGNAKGAVKGAVNGAKEGAKTAEPKPKADDKPKAEPNPTASKPAPKLAATPKGSELEEQIRQLAAQGIYARQYMRNLLLEYEQSDLDYLRELEETVKNQPKARPEGTTQKAS